MLMHRGLATMGRFGRWAKPTALDHGPNLAQALFTGVSFFSEMFSALQQI
jgi:hypothetical protein